MPMSKHDIEEMMRLIGLTKDSEINCEQCLALVAEFAEQQLAGKSVHEGLKAVEHHLSICPECREEYEALQRALGEMEDEADK
jgi:predicted anti-sigma-YlaC factor YlaD